MTIEIPKKSENYLERTHKDYEMTSPDHEGDLCIATDDDEFRMYFSKDDLILMLSRFNP